MKQISKSVLFSFLALTLLIGCSSTQKNSSGSKADAEQKLSPENVMKKLVLANSYFAKKYPRAVQILKIHKLFENRYLKSNRTNVIADFMLIC